MAVLIEAWSVIVRRDAVDARFNGKWQSFLSSVPNRTLCFDTKLARVAFMAWGDAEAYMKFLVANGLVQANNEHWLDMVVLNHDAGLEEPAPWLKTVSTTLKPGQHVLVAWLSERTSPEGITYFPTEFAAPEGWAYETSLLAHSKLVPDIKIEGYTFLRRENGQDVYLDSATGKEMFVART